MAFTTDFSGGDYEDKLQRYSTTAMQRAEDIANRPFVRYEGERVAGFTAPELEGRQAAMELARQGIGSPQVQQAADVMSQAAQYQAGPYAAQTAAGTSIAPYMSEYYMGAVQPALEELRRQQTLSLQGVGDAAARAGSFGGSRHGVTEAEAMRGYGQQMSDLISGAQARAYETAAGLREQDIGRLNQEQQIQEAMRLSGLQAQMAGATGLSQVANQMRDMGYSDADIMRQLGQEERALEQARLDVPYQEFQREQAFPFQALQAQLAPLGLGAQVATAAPTIDEPSYLQNILGGVGYAANVAGGLGKAGISASDIGGFFKNPFGLFS